MKIVALGLNFHLQLTSHQLEQQNFSSNHLKGQGSSCPDWGSITFNPNSISMHSHALISTLIDQFKHQLGQLASIYQNPQFFPKTLSVINPNFSNHHNSCNQNILIASTQSSKLAHIFNCIKTHQFLSTP